MSRHKHCRVEFRGQDKGYIFFISLKANVFFERSLRFHVKFMVIHQTVASSLLATTTVWMWSRLPGGIARGLILAYFTRKKNTARFSRGLCMFLTVFHAILGCVSLEDPNLDLWSNVTRVIVQQKNLWFLVKAAFALRHRNLVSLWKRIKGFTSAQRKRKRNTHESFWICAQGKLGQGNHVMIIATTILFDKLRFENVLRPHEN